MDVIYDHHKPSSTATKCSNLSGCSANYWLHQQLSDQFQAVDQPLQITHRVQDISPLGLELNFLEPSQHYSTRQQIDDIEKEMSLRAKGIERRPVHLLTLRDPKGNLSHCDLTELMFTLGHHFHLNHNGQRIYCLETRPDSLNVDTLALLKGLGFNRLQLQASCLSDGGVSCIRQLRKVLARLNDYDFPSPNWEMSLNAHQSDNLYLQLDHLITLRPPRIQLLDIAPDNQQGNVFQEIFTNLRNAGYRVIGNDCFVLPHHPLAKAQQQQQLRTTVSGYNASNVADWVGLGLGALTQLGNLYYRNSSDHQYRHQRLTQDLLAIDARLLPSDKQQSLLQALNTLNAYHQLDFNYYRSRYQIDLESSAEAALASEAITEYAVIRRHHLYLHEDGIVKLPEILNALGLNAA